MNSRWSQERYLEAYRFAAEAHQGQLYPGTEISYIMHLGFVAMEVLGVLAHEPGHDGDLALTCALLHDVLEDTAVDADVLTRHFGAEVAAGVSALTKDVSLPETEQMADSLRRILQQPRAVWLVKLGDRISNLQRPPSHWTRDRRLRYREEATAIHAALAGASDYLGARLAAKIEAYAAYLDETSGARKQPRAATPGAAGTVLWLTGLSGSGKTTLARALEMRLNGKERLNRGERLDKEPRSTIVLDGDMLRRGLTSDLGFSAADRDENIRRAGEVAALLADAGLLTICAFVSPYRAARQKARAAVAPALFFEVFVDASLETCERRDPKGLYARARAGEVADFTGIDAPYEAPEAPDLHVSTDESSIEDCVDALERLLDGTLEGGGWANPQKGGGGR